MTKDTTLWQIFFGTLYLFDSIFSIIVWRNRSHDFDEGICFLDNCCHENGLKTFLQWSEQRLLRGKDASVGNSMLNHPGHVTLTLRIFLELLTSGKYHRDVTILKILASNSKWFRVYGIFNKWKIDDDRKRWPNTTFP